MIDELLPRLLNLGCIVEPCGSRVTCDPAPMNTDADLLVEILIGKDRMQRVAGVVSLLEDNGFSWEGSIHYQDAAGTFMSWRKGEQNLIVTASHDFAQRHRAATQVCKKLNLMVKADRIALFQAVLYGAISDGFPSERRATEPTQTTESVF